MLERRNKEEQLKRVETESSGVKDGSVFYWRFSGKNQCNTIYNQNEIDLVYIRDGSLHCVEIKAGSTFKDHADKAFRQLDETQYNRGRNAIVCTADKLSAMKSGTLIVPVTSI